MTRTILVLPILVMMCPAAAAQTTQPPQPLPTTTVNVTVVATPLPGEPIPVGMIPAPVQTAAALDIQNSGALDLSSFLERRMTGVYLNDVQNNPFQSDLNYRGYTASPLLGTPQGLSVYMDGVRLNQPFGEIVSWDLIPRLAISSATLMPGSNPLFGLNTLGGAVTLQTKTGLSHPGTTVQATYGSDVRRVLDVEHGGRSASTAFHWYLAGSLFDEEGWRDHSPSSVRQVFGKAGWKRDAHEIALSASHADTSLTGNGLQDLRLLGRDYASVYTLPDTTENRSTLVGATSRHRLDARTFVETGAYYRRIRTATLNGDINEDSLDQSMYQPTAVERAALAAAGYGSVPAGGLDADNTPFPSLRCIANVLLGDEPAEKCNGSINRTRTAQQSGGGSAQVTRRDPVRRAENTFTVGASFDRSGIGFGQSTELGYLNPDRSVTGVGAFGDGVSGGSVDGEPFDTRVDLHGTVTTASAFVADVFPLRRGAHLSFAGRFNYTSIVNRDRVQPGGGAGSLDGDHAFARFNPAIGVTWDVTATTGVYAGYSEGSRAPTSIELGCADPAEPCKLPNAMAGDPPLEQVVTRNVEAGARGRHGRYSWSAALFRAANDHDILFVTSDQTGFGYFRNFGGTLRQGLEVSAQGRLGSITFGAGYTYLAATFDSDETVNGESNSTNDAALEGVPGVEGTIAIEPGDRLPLVPRHVFKAFADAELTPRLGVDLDVLAVGSSYARGNENNAHEPDGGYYLGPGAIAAYTVVNLGARYRLTRWLQVIGQVNNLFNREYVTAAQLGPTGFTASGRYIARPFPAIAGEFPVQQTTFVSPGAPGRVWIGLRARF